MIFLRRFRVSIWLANCGSLSIVAKNEFPHFTYFSAASIRDDSDSSAEKYGTLTSNRDK